MKTMILASSIALACEARAAESRTARTFDAGPAIQGNSDPAMPMHKKRVKAAPMHRKAM